MATLTPRQREIKARLDKGKQAREIAEELGISRNAVYQHIQTLRKHGVLSSDFTPTGQPVREMRPGEDILRRITPVNAGDADGMTEAAGFAALVSEIRRTRDELDAIARRLSFIIPR